MEGWRCAIGFDGFCISRGAGVVLRFKPIANRRSGMLFQADLPTLACLGPIVKGFSTVRQRGLPAVLERTLRTGEATTDRDSDPRPPPHIFCSAAFYLHAIVGALLASTFVVGEARLTLTHTMQKLRSIHLYTGCVFAPLLLFFAVSGIGQTFGLHNRSHFLARLATIHTSHGLKAGGSLSSVFLMGFVVIMAVSFIMTTVLGIVMALKFGRSRRVAFYCLAAGVVIPLAIIVLTAWTR